MDIDKIRGDLYIWREILDCRRSIRGLLTCGSDYAFSSKLEVDNPRLGEIYDEIRTKLDTDRYADGIWSVKCSKLTIALWRSRWRLLNTHARLRD